MTRINLVPVEELTDQHLFAEYREIKMVPKSLARSLKAAWQREFGKNDSEAFASERVRLTVEKVKSKIPSTFTLGTGHVSFFYDKGFYLGRRYEQIVRELVCRDFRMERKLFDPDRTMQPDVWWGNYYPEGDGDAMSIIRTRIAEKIAMKPHWYKYYGQPIFGTRADPTTRQQS